MDKENKLILYKDEEGRVSVNTRFADEDVWLTQAQLVEIYQSSKSNISEHLTNIFADKELEQDAKWKRGEYFNVFEVLGLSTKEVRLHSAFLPELLNPNGSHGLGDKMLRSF